MLNRILNVFNRLFVVWIVLAGVVAYYWPGFYTPLKKYNELFFALTMFGVGMVLNPEDFINIFKNFKVVLIGVTSQFTIMPLLAFFVARAFALPDELALGLILAGSAPGAMASNVLCYLARADVAYSVSLTTVSTLLAPVLTPLLTLLLAQSLFKVSFWAMFWSVSRMVLLPLIFGLVIKRLFDKKVDPIVKIFPAFSTIFIAFVCGLVIALNRNYVPQIDGWILLAVILLNLLGLALGYGVGVISGFDKIRKRALSIEIGMQNAGLGSVLALKHFGERAALPAVIFVFICIFSASILVPIWARDYS